MGTRKDLAGHKFGRLSVKEFLCIDRPRGARWRCQCECGSLVEVHTNDLTTGNTRSCGCLMRDVASQVNLLHGNAREGNLSGAYRSYRSMLARCTYQGSVNYKNYGGRGIKVCERWSGDDGFSNFLSDMGERPNGGSLERNNVNGDYEPSNCRWLPCGQQARNTRATVWVLVNGVRMCQAEAARAIGMHKSVLSERMKRGTPLPAGVEAVTA